MTVFGNMTAPQQVEQAVIDTIEVWIEAYLREVEFILGWDGQVPSPRSYRRVNDFDPADVEQLPLLLVVCPGMTSQPRMEGNGSYNVRWGVGVGCLVSARTFVETRDLAGLYATAVRALLLQKGSLGGFADGTYWLDERYDDAPSDLSRTIGSAQVMFEIEVSDVVNRRRGPVSLPVEPGQQNGRFELVEVTVRPEE